MYQRNLVYPPLRSARSAGSCEAFIESGPDRDSWFAHSTVWRASKTRFIFYGNRGEGRWHAAKPMQQRSVQTLPTCLGERSTRGWLSAEGLEMEREQIRRWEEPAWYGWYLEQGHFTPHWLVALLIYRPQEMASIDNSMKSKLNNYNLVKGSLTQMQRKKTFVPLQQPSTHNNGYTGGTFPSSRWLILYRRRTWSKIPNTLKLF